MRYTRSNSSRSLHDRVPLSEPGQVKTSLSSHCPNERALDEEEDWEDDEVRISGCVAEAEE